MKTPVIFSLSLIIVFFFSANGFAFRCGNGLVTSGDTRMQVSVTCGKPTSKEKTCEENQVSTRKDKNGKIIKTKKCANKVEIWYYNCGDNDYIYALTFDEGKLIKENTVGRGRGNSDCLGK